jgi:hypothetical protein
MKTEYMAPGAITFELQFRQRLLDYRRRSSEWPAAIIVNARGMVHRATARDR